MNMQMARTLSVAAAFAASAFSLGGCSSSSGTGAMPSPQADGSTARQAPGRPSVILGAPVELRPDRGRSWMTPGASQQTLLYVSDIGTSTVQAFTYPQGKLAGTLTGFGYPQGLCSDSSGNLYVTDAGNDDIVEYAHGGTTPIATLNDANSFPASCAVDPSSGNIAVANLLTSQNFEAGNVAIYPPGQTNATAYADPNMTREYFLAYDSSGNIFVDGVNGTTGYFRYAEMSPGGSFTDITVKAKIGFPGGVQQDGSDMAVGDQQGPVAGRPDVYRVSSSGAVDGKTTLRTASNGRLIDPAQFVLVAKSATKNDIVTADALGATVYVNAFPKGTYVSSFTSGLVQPLGVTLSSPAGH
jgi:hypothetical protein